MLIYGFSFIVTGIKLAGSRSAARTVRRDAPNRWQSNHMCNESNRVTVKKNLSRPLNVAADFTSNVAAVFACYSAKPAMAIV